MSSINTKEITNVDAKKDILSELGAKYGCDFGRETIVRLELTIFSRICQVFDPLFSESITRVFAF